MIKFILELFCIVVVCSIIWFTGHVLYAWGGIAFLLLGVILNALSILIVAIGLFIVPTDVISGGEFVLLIAAFFLCGIPFYRQSKKLPKKHLQEEYSITPDKHMTERLTKPTRQLNNPKSTPQQTINKTPPQSSQKENANFTDSERILLSMGKFALEQSEDNEERDYHLKCNEAYENALKKKYQEDK